MKNENDSKLTFTWIIWVISLYIAIRISSQYSILPFTDQMSIKGPLTEIEYNPRNDIYNFLFIIIFPSFILVCIYLIKKNYFTHTFRYELSTYRKFSIPITKKHWLFAIMFALIVAINIPTYLSSDEYVDTFHEGESLGTAISYMANMTPYKDFVFAHGIFQDPLRAVLAFTIFERSIGSLRVVESMLKLLSYILLFIVLIKLLSRLSYAYLSFIIFVILSSPVFLYFPRLLIIPTRDITTFLFLYLFLQIIDYLEDKMLSKFKLAIFAFLFAFISFATFIYSIDRGFYLTATYLLISPLIFSLFIINTNYTKSVLFASILGILSAVLILGYFIKWDFSSFVNFVLLEMPKWKDFVDGKKYPFNSPMFLLPIILSSINLWYLGYSFLGGINSFSKTRFYLTFYFRCHIREICLFIMSIFYYRSALGRSDWDHVIYSSLISYFLSLYIYFKHILQKSLVKKRINKIICFVTKITVAIFCILATYSVIKYDLLKWNFPINKDDSQFIPENYTNAIEFLESRLDVNDTFFTMTSEAIWYYFLDTPCPSRFPVVWFAMPMEYQRQVVDDLEKNNVKLILYKNTSFAYQIDGFTSEERLPIITEYIIENYTFLKQVDDNEIWVKRSVYTN
ncbi:MAG: hypothetical protein JXB49_31565 [Bacteroidales bacterium]|nr:hypothetical protein [Bacteroidales bacterium]